MTVPSGFRRSAAIPRALVLHLADVPAAEVEIVGGMPATTVLGTILDVAANEAVAIENLRAALV